MYGAVVGIYLGVNMATENVQRAMATHSEDLLSGPAFNRRVRDKQRL